ncbi:MAG: hypothetical protein AABW91_04170 [Nanoarchaeota archaeon]
MIATLETQVEEDIEFLKKLNKRTCKVNVCHEGVYKGYTELDCKYDEKITEDEIARALEILERRDDLVIYPTTTNFGFSVSFEISRGTKSVPSVKAEKERVLIFSERQLPEGYDFKALSPHFLSERNKRLMKWYDFEIDPRMNDRSHWDY